MEPTCPYCGLPPHPPSTTPGWSNYEERLAPCVRSLGALTRELYDHVRALEDMLTATRQRPTRFSDPRRSLPPHLFPPRPRREPSADPPPQSDSIEEAGF